MDEQRNATKSQFEIERDGQTARLAYEVDSEGWISLLHTFVPPALRGRGIANELAKMGLEYAKEHRLKVEIVCPVVFHYTTKHPEYKPLLGIRGYKPAQQRRSEGECERVSVTDGLRCPGTHPLTSVRSG